MTTYYECPNCMATPTEEEWNKYNKLAIMTFGFLPLPEGLDDGSSYDCPECEERVESEDLLVL